MKKITTLLSFLFSTLILLAQPPKQKTLLWQISGKAISQPSYLFGTFHLLCSKDFTVPDTIQHLMSVTQQLYLELDIDDPKLNAAMMKGIRMKDNKTLKEFIAAKDYDSVAKIFKDKTGMPLSMVQNYKPFMLSSMLYPSILDCPTVSVEMELAKIAKQNNYETFGLETVEDQLAVFDKIPYENQAKTFVDMLYNFNKSKAELNNMLLLYKSQNIKKLYKSINSDSNYGNFETELLKTRNQNWIPVIEKQATTKPTFFAVGAGHLGGKFGVINLLRKQGYTVTPIYYQ
jgi:uncharacterized protein YbaP (TraB family)